MRSRKRAILHSITAAAVALALWFAPAGAYAGGEKPLKFSVSAMAEAVDGNATEAGFRTESGNECRLALTSFNVSNGEGAAMVSAYFATADEANRYLDWRLKSDGEIKKQGPNTIAGKLVGRRAVVLLKTNGWEVIWTYGSTFRSFTSVELSVALELEKRNKAPDFWNGVLAGK